jgi:polysaccharide export outer membrane protein
VPPTATGGPLRADIKKKAKLPMTLRPALRGIGLLLIVALMAACSQLPRSAAVEREITRSSSDVPTDFAVYPVTRAFLPVVQDWPQTGTQTLGWLPTSGGARTQVIAPGDELQITIWDSTGTSLLSAADERAVQIQSLVVQPDGTIFVPYVGDTRVSGMTVQIARVHLQDEISGIAPSSQVQLQMVSGRSNSVDLVGGVNTPGSYPLPDRNYTILNLIAQGGGVRDGLTNPQVRLMRGGSIYGTSVDRLFSSPQHDTLLHGGDRVIVEAEDRSFLSLGAAGQQNQHLFPTDHVTALEAMSIIGGVQGDRGDPGGILILREYPDAAVRAGDTGPDQTRVVFSVDLTSADGLFSARNFHIHPGDLVLVTESPVTGVQTIFALIGSAFGIVGQSGGLSN